eukprot:jgi/Ulvmu1/11074/UM007_0256.1
MGCCSSKVSALPHGYGMGTEPKYRGVKQTQDQDVTILWDTDDVCCPPDNYTSLLFLNALHKTFVQNLSRKEPRVVLVYDDQRALNMSREAVALRSYLQTESVELLGSQGTTQQTLEDEIRKIVANAGPKSTIVLISSPATYKDACACARQHDIFVERLFSTSGLSRFADESNANWMCSLDHFLKANSVTDWRFDNGDQSSSVTFRSKLHSEVPCAGQTSLDVQASGESPPAAAARYVETKALHEEFSTQAPAQSTPANSEVKAEMAAGVIACSRNYEADGVWEKRDKRNLKSQAKDDADSEAAPIIEVSAVTEMELADMPAEDAITARASGSAAGADTLATAANSGATSTYEVAHAAAEPVQAEIVCPPQEPVPADDPVIIQGPASNETNVPTEQAAPMKEPAPNEVPVAPEEPTASVEASPDTAAAAVLCSAEEPAPEEVSNAMLEPTAEPDDLSVPILDGEETCDSSIGLAVDTMLDDVQTGLMQEFGSTDGSSLGGGGAGGNSVVGEPDVSDFDEPPAQKRGSAKGAQKSAISFAEPHTSVCETAADAAVEALAGADSADAAPDPTNAPTRASVSRLGLSMRRGYTRVPSAVHEGDLAMDIEPMDPHAAAVDDGAETTVAPLPQITQRDAPEVVPMIGPDPEMAWKAEVMRTLRACSGKAVKVETLLGMVPHPTQAGGAQYRAQLEEHLIDRKLAVWAEDGYAIQLVSA